MFSCFCLSECRTLAYSFNFLSHIWLIYCFFQLCVSRCSTEDKKITTRRKEFVWEKGRKAYVLLNCFAVNARILTYLVAKCDDLLLFIKLIWIMYDVQYFFFEICLFKWVTGQVSFKISMFFSFFLYFLSTFKQFNQKFNAFEWLLLCLFSLVVFFLLGKLSHFKSDFV